MTQNKETSYAERKDRLSPSVTSEKKVRKKGRGKREHDHLTKEYFRTPEIFCDFISAITGRRIDLSPDMVRDMESSILLSDSHMKDNARIFVTKEVLRDISKHVKNHVTEEEMNICIEDQSSYDKNMALRILAYDAMGYLSSSSFCPTMTILLNWDAKKRYPKQLDLLSLFEGKEINPYVKEHMARLNIAAYNVVDYINDENRPDFKTNLRTVFALISGALNDMTIQEIVEKCSWVEKAQISPLEFMLVNLYLDIEMDEEENNEEINVMTVYQKSVQKEREQALKIGRDEGMAEGISKGMAEGISKGMANAIYSTALLLSRKEKCSFESVLDKLEIPESERPAYLERYSRECNA